MSKKCKLKNRLEHLEQKRARKASNKAKYAELRRLGINGKSKRSISNKRKNRLIAQVDHPFGNCGNIGCKKCFPELHLEKNVVQTL